MTERPSCCFAFTSLRATVPKAKLSCRGLLLTWQIWHRDGSEGLRACCQKPLSLSVLQLRDVCVSQRRCIFERCLPNRRSNLRYHEGVIHFQFLILIISKPLFIWGCQVPVTSSLSHPLSSTVQTPLRIPRVSLRRSCSTSGSQEAQQLLGCCAGRAGELQGLIWENDSGCRAGQNSYFPCPVLPSHRMKQNSSR